MVKGPAYHRFKQLDRPSVGEYVNRVVINSNKKINTKKTKCKYCGYEAFYEFKRCPECGNKKRSHKEGCK